MQNLPIKKDDQTWTVSAKQKTNLYAEYLEETFKPFPHQTAEEDLMQVRRRDRLQILPVTLRELKNTIKTNLNAKKRSS